MKNLEQEKKGILLAAAASMCYGTNPLFTLPLYAGGIGVNSVLFYRYAFAIVLYGFWLGLVKKIDLRIPKNTIFPIFAMGLCFSFSSLFLYMAFRCIDAGIACTILFCYPMFVAIIMAVFFKEKLTKNTVFALLLSFVGIVLLHDNSGGSSVSLKGIVLVLLSALSYAIYIVGVKTIKSIRTLKSDILTFYVMLFGLAVYIVNLKFCTQLQIIRNPLLWLSALALSLIPTIISIETIGEAIKIIGPTKTAVMGALEPITAIFFGITIFHEQLSVKITAGIILTILGVLTIFKKEKHQKAG